MEDFIDFVAIFVIIGAVIVIILHSKGYIDFSTETKTTYAQPSGGNYYAPSKQSWEANAPSQEYVRNVKSIADDFGEDPEYVDKMIRAAALKANR